MLEAVGEVVVQQHNSTTLLLVFSPPATLDGVPIDYYTVEITSLDLSTNITVTLDHTHFYYTPQDICTDYSFEIAASNKAGKGDPVLRNATVYQGIISTLH